MGERECTVSVRKKKKTCKDFVTTNADRLLMLLSHSH